MRQQLLPLPLCAADLPTAAGLAREAWLGLAGAAHHHAYELAPTARAECMVSPSSLFEHPAAELSGDDSAGLRWHHRAPDHDA
jgi:hypothetical protein